MNRAWHWGCLLLALGLPLFGCGVAVDQDLAEFEAKIRREFPSVTQISTEDLAGWLADPDRPPPIIIDARAPEEFAVSHLPGALHAQNREQVEALTAGEKNRDLVLYCSVGYRSSILAERLAESGFQNVRNLEGSIFRWANEGRPLYRGSTPVEVVHPYDDSWGRFLDRRFWSYTP